MVKNQTRPCQLRGPTAATRFVQVEFYWREILKVEPDTNPWEFACKMRKCRLITPSEIWDVATWADLVREDVRQLQLKEIVRDIQEIAKKLI